MLNFVLYLFHPGALSGECPHGKYQPLSRPIFIYVNKKAADTRPEVAKFVEFYQNPKNAVELIKEVGYVTLPEAALKVFQERFKKREIGTGFTGSKVGISVEDLVKEKLVC